MKARTPTLLLLALTASAGPWVILHADPQETPARGAPARGPEDAAERDSRRMITEGRQTFRHDTFGSEAFWGDGLRLHEAIVGQGLGGVGAGVSPKAALGLGLKVDAAALPPAVVEGIKSGAVSLDKPETTQELLKLDAVIGVKGIFDDSKQRVRSIGIQCALCHSTVDDSFSPGIGRRLDGWPNRDLNVGAIISIAPNLKAVADFLGTDLDTVKKVLAAWGPGRFDASRFVDGKGLRPDGKTAAVLIPPAYGLAGVDLHTYTGWGSVTYWNAFVANLEMHGVGNFTDARLDDAKKFPVAARHKLGHVRVPPDKDRISSKLAALHYYQLSIEAPRPKAGSFVEAAAGRGKAVFEGKATCASCHVGERFTDAGWNMHTADEIGIDSFQADRSPDGRYRTTPLRGLGARTTQKGGFYHDGRFPDLRTVVAHYNQSLSSS